MPSLSTISSLLDPIHTYLLMNAVVNTPSLPGISEVLTVSCAGTGSCVYAKGAWLYPNVRSSSESCPCTGHSL